jgi:hypothetical protein
LDLVRLLVAGCATYQREHMRLLLLDRVHVRLSLLK